MIDRYVEQSDENGFTKTSYMAWSSSWLQISTGRITSYINTTERTLYIYIYNMLSWFANCALKDVSARPKYILVPLSALFSTSARFRFSVRHWFCNGHFSLIRQLQPYSVFLGLNSFLLCNETIDDMLRFNYFRSILPIFVLTLREKGGLIQIILCFRCFLQQVLWLVFVFGMKTNGSLNLLFFNASEFIGVAFWKNLCVRWQVR